MTPEREFISIVLSRYLDSSPEQAKKSAIDLCIKYLEQEEKLQRLQEHCQLLEEKIEEMNIDYQVVKAELEVERQLNQTINTISNKSIKLPRFLFPNSQ